MAGEEEILLAAKKARVMGLVLCLAWPLVLMALLTVGVMRPGTLPVQGWVEQTGYTFTALTLLAAGYITHRSGKVLAAFREVPEGERARVVFRTTLGFSILCSLSTFYGLVYWRLAGHHAARHALAYMALSALMFMIFVPRGPQWLKSLEPQDPK